ncbi:MAG: ABC transporter permease [Bradymonadaceae bacterium]|nr:ABC transporter permease [Lujinxingiaceae bacterium]
MFFDHFAWSIALRGLQYNKGQTLLSVGVVAISVTLIIFLGSLIGGLQARIIDNVTGAIAHIDVTPAEREILALWQFEQPGVLYGGQREAIQPRQATIEDWSVWVDRLELSHPQILAVSPTVEGQGFVSRGARREAVRLVGMIPRRHNAIVDVESDLVSGRFFDLDSAEIAMGRPLAEELGVGQGDRVRLVSATGNIADFTVAGVFETGYQGVDSVTIFLPLRDAQSLFGVGSAVTNIGLKLERIFEADRVATSLEGQVPYELTSWMADNERMLSALRAQSQSSTLILVFTTIAAGFAIASILIMLVVSKLREVGILKAMGATRRQITTIFALEGTLMASLGALAGTVLGVGLSLLVAQVRAGDDRQVFPIEVTVEVVITAIVVAVTVGFVASLYPARRAAKVDPIEVIRGN